MVSYSYAVLLLLSVLVKHGFGELDTYYSGDVAECENFENIIVDVDLEVQFNVVDDDLHQSLSGTITVNEEIPEGTRIQVNIAARHGPNDQELLYAVYADLCESLTNEEYFWYDLYKQMGISKCPILPGSYELEQTNPEVNSKGISQSTQRDLSQNIYAATAYLADKDKNIFFCYVFDVNIDFYEDEDD